MKEMDLTVLVRHNLFITVTYLLTDFAYLASLSFNVRVPPQNVAVT